MTSAHRDIQYKTTTLHQRLKTVIFVTFVMIALLSVFLNSAIMNYARTHERHHFRKLAEIAQLSLDPALIKNLKASPEDLSTPAHQMIKETLRAVRDADSSYRFAYLMAMKNGQVLFLADAEPESSPDFSPPGQPYPDASERLHRIFDDGVPFVEGPIIDKWGEWISAHAAVRDRASSEIVAIIGLDINTMEWNASTNAYRLFSITITLLITIIAATFSLALYRTSKDRNRIGSINSELQQTRKELLQSERLAVLGQLNAVVSHEIRNPLGTLSNALAMLDEAVERNDSEMYLKSMDLCTRNVDRCNRIISELLDFSKTSNMSKEKIYIDRWLEEILSQSPALVNVTIEKDFAVGTEVEINPDSMHRAIDNVCQNAAQAMPAESEVDAVLKVQTRQTEDRLEMKFTDNGSGISSEVMDKIFDPMFSTKSFGVGLGLPIVGNIMTDHGGGVEIDSEPGKGTTVTLWLPVH